MVLGIHYHQPLRPPNVGGDARGLDESVLDDATTVRRPVLEPASKRVGPLVGAPIMVVNGRELELDSAVYGLSLHDDVGSETADDAATPVVSLGGVY